MTRPPLRPGLAARAVAVVLAWLAITGLLTVAGEAVAHSARVARFDTTITSFIVEHRSSTLNSVMEAVTWLGSWVALVVAGVLLAVLCVRRQLTIAAFALAVAAWAGESGGISLVKRIVRRDRPPEDVQVITAHGWSFPSGHTGVAALIFTVLAFIAMAFTRSTSARVMTWAAAAVAIVAVAFSRVELGVHWTTDVVASLLYVAGLLIALRVLLPTAVRPPARSEARRGRQVASGSHTQLGPM